MLSGRVKHLIDSVVDEAIPHRWLRVSYKVKRRAHSVISDAIWIFRCLLTNLVEGGQLVHVRMGPAITMLYQAIERDARRFYGQWVADDNDTTVSEGAKGIIDRLVSMGGSERPKTLGKAK